MTHGITKSGFDILASRLQHKQLELAKLQEEISSIQTAIKLRRSFLPEDFRLIAAKLKEFYGEDFRVGLTSLLLSSVPTILAALDLAASCEPQRTA